MYRKYEKKQHPSKNESVTTLVKLTVPIIVDIYKRASIPTLSEENIVVMITNYHGNYRYLMTNYKRDYNEGTFQNKMKEFIDNSMKLCDFASCKFVSNCQCKCIKNLKVPKAEVFFLQDQKSTYNLFIGHVDVDEGMTKILQRRLFRQRQQSDEKTILL